MKKLLFILLVIGFSAFQVNAQSPGYMGKHIVISAEGTFSGSMFIMKKAWLKYGSTVEFVVGKTSSFGLGYLYNSSKFPYETFQFGCYNYYKNSSKLISHTIGLDYYKYFGGSIAPLGDFFRVRAFYMFNKSEDFFVNRVYNGNSYNCNTYESSINSYDNFGLSIFFGRKRIFYNSLSVAYGFKLGMVFINPLTIGDLDSFSNNTSIMKEYGAYENFFSTLISLDVNIGFVL